MYNYDLHVVILHSHVYYSVARTTRVNVPVLSLSDLRHLSMVFSWLGLATEAAGRSSDPQTMVSRDTYLMVFVRLPLLTLDAKNLEHWLSLLRSKSEVMCLITDVKLRNRQTRLRLQGLCNHVDVANI